MSTEPFREVPDLPAGLHRLRVLSFLELALAALRRARDKTSGST